MQISAPARIPRIHLQRFVRSPAYPNLGRSSWASESASSEARMVAARSLSTGLLVAGLFWVCTGGGRSAEPSRRVVFDIPGRSDATPSVGTYGSFVTVVWGATVE